MSDRQAKRIRARYQLQGDAAVVHQLRGRPSNRQAADGLKAKVLELYQTKYADYGPTLASECLAEDDGLTVLPETLRRWLKSSGLGIPRRRRKVHRWRRARKQHRGNRSRVE